MSFPILDSLSEGDNKSFDKLKEKKTNQDVVNYSKIKSRSSKPSWKCSVTSSKTRSDIDIGYAIRQLKKEDQTINVYSHLQGILDKILSERPINPVENFEKYSMRMKRSYINKEVNFERVFVNNIHQSCCLKSLQMCKCAMKKQSNKRKQYDGQKGIEKSETLKNEKPKLNSVDDGAEVHVQNLWEVNYMFNKAGCGLSSDQVTLISLTMNGLAQLNRFKTIRFWGKIFGLNKPYYVIECEHTDEILNRELLLEENRNAANMKLSKDSGFSSRTKWVEESRSLFHVDGSSVDNGRFTYDGSSLDSNETVFSLVTSYDCVEKSENLPAETIGTGANRRVYLVTNELSSKWIELRSVQPHHIVEARRIKRYFTGKLNQPINNFHRFSGLELDYLRAQIARISASTQICPQGYYKFDDEQMTNNDKQTTDQSTISDKKTKKIDCDLILNKDFTSIPNKKLVELNSWVHMIPKIGDTGVTNYTDGPSEPTTRASNYEDNEEFEEELFDEFEELDSHIENSSSAAGDLYGNLRNDTAADKTPAWKSVLCSPSNYRYSHTVVTSHVWPGAYAVAYKSKMDFVYMGWGQKRSCPFIDGSKMDGLKMENLTDQCPTEFVEFSKKKQTTDLNQKLQNETEEESVVFDQLDEYNVEMDETFKDTTYD